MIRRTSCIAAALAVGLAVVHADDGLGLKRGGNPSDVTISGVSSGAAMAVQYAVAHSQSIAGVGGIAGPAWGCADGSPSQAVNDCMCGRHALEPKIDAARQLATSGKIDSLFLSGNPQALKRSYVFHSPADDTVVEQSGKASVAFLSAFIGDDPKVDWGNTVDGSDKAGHGIIAPDSSNESCQANGKETTYVRRCGAEDNVGKMFHALYDPNSVFDSSRRVNNIPGNEVWQFDQKQLIDQVKRSSKVAPDGALFWPFRWWTFSSSRRKNLDMAEQGYIYVPPSCRPSGSTCRVHIALHGCKQNAKDFASRAGYNNWADQYRVVIVYPAVEPSTSLSEAACQMSPVDSSIDELIKLNPNGCWDWWGYLETSDQKNRYLTRDSPQMLVIERIIAQVTGR